MLRKKWFNPARSLQKNGENMTFVQRLEGVYRVFAGRLNQPKVIVSYDLFNDDQPVYSSSKNHAGLYDVLTFGLLNAAESFLRGNWLETGSTSRNVFRAVMAPLWLPLNGLRALVAGLFTLFALPAVAIVHSIVQSHNQAVIANAIEVATKAAVTTANLAKIDPSLAKNAAEALKLANHVFNAGNQGLASVADAKAKAAEEIAKSSAAVVSEKLNGKSKADNVKVMTDARKKKLHPVKYKLNEVKQALNDKAAVKKAAKEAKQAAKEAKQAEQHQVNVAKEIQAAKDQKEKKDAPKPEGFFKKAKENDGGGKVARIFVGV